MQALEFLLLMGWPALLCLIAGLALVIFEMFTPGFNIPGILGLVLLTASVVLSANSFEQALAMILIILVLLTAAFLLAMHSASKGALSRSPLILHRTAKREDGYLSVQDMEYFVGQQGIAATVLRPAGTGDFQGVRLDVVTEGDYIQKGASIQVVKVEGRRIVVRQIAPPAQQSA